MILTVSPWVVWAVLSRDAKARGLDLACVWKKHNRAEGDRGAVDAGEGAVIMRAAQFFPMVARLEKLERLELERDDEYTRGWLAHERHTRQAEEAV